MVKDEARAIGKALARRRTIAGLTQEEVAERLGVGQEAVSRMERGVANLTVARLASLAEIYQCNVAQLITESSDREDDQALALSSVLGRLPQQDRALLIEWLNIFAARFEQARQGKNRPGQIDHADGVDGAGQANVFDGVDGAGRNKARGQDGARRLDGAGKPQADGADSGEIVTGARRRQKAREAQRRDGESSNE